MRPALVLLCAEAVGGVAGQALPAAVAVELVHNFSLLHDDVMDRDTLRRHRPSVWSVFGATNAILTGDALHSLAFAELALNGDDGGRARRLSEALLRLVRGQCADVGFERRMGVGLAECLNMARDKTGALLAVACALGAEYGGGSGDQVERLSRFGMHLGLAFQLADDLLGIWGDQQATGKPTGTDLRRRKKSLPVVAALTRRHPAARRLAALYSGTEPPDDDDVAAAARLIEEAGGRAWAHGRLARELAAAEKCLAACAPCPAPAAELLTLTGLIAGRGEGFQGNPAAAPGVAACDDQLYGRSAARSLADFLAARATLGGARFHRARPHRIRDHGPDGLGIREHRPLPHVAR